MSKAVEAILVADHYTYRVSWSEEDGECIGTCVEFPSLSHFAESRAEALRGIEALVRDVVAEMHEAGEQVPTPIADQAFSGQFTTRIHQELHRRLALEAAEAGISLSRLVTLKLTAPLPAPVRVRPAKRRDTESGGDKRSA